VLADSRGSRRPAPRRGIDHNAVAKREAVDAFAERLDDSGTSAPMMRGFGTDGSPCGIQTSSG